MIYFRLIAASLRSQLQYRVSFLLDALGAFLATFVEFAALALAFGRFGGLGGWYSCFSKVGCVGMTSFLPDLTGVQRDGLDAGGIFSAQTKHHAVYRDRF